MADVLSTRRMIPHLRVNLSSQKGYTLPLEFVTNSKGGIAPRRQEDISLGRFARPASALVAAPP